MSANQSPSHTALMHTVTIRSNLGDYAVDLGRRLDEVVNTLAATQRSVVVVDQNVHRLYRESLAPLIESRPTLAFHATEQEKSLDGAAKVFNFFQAANCTRNTTVIALGGGIVQDVVAFCTHLYYRGISWVFVPTTLLSMADSCIGAKCAINFNGFKNQLGTFQTPERIYIAPEFVDTLSDPDVRSGYGEILKLLLTGDPDGFDRLLRVVHRDGFRSAALLEFVRASLAVKQQIIEIDEFERDLRRILNYGHTFGHALESLSDYAIPHGIAVAWGMDLVNWIAVQRGVLDRAEFERIHEFLQCYYRWQLPAPVSAASLIEAVRRDKKVIHDKIALILLERIGKLSIVPTNFDRRLEEEVTSYLADVSIIEAR